METLNVRFGLITYTLGGIFMKLLKLLSMVTLALLFVASSFAIPSKDEAAKLAAENQSEVFTVGTNVTIGDEELGLDEADVAVTIGTGTGVSGIPSPFYDYYHNEFSCALYLASEITAAGGSAGLITHLRWYVQTAKTFANREGYIWFKTTTATTLPTQNYAGAISGATQVWTTTTLTGGSPAGAWQEFDISDFTWNGTDNLIIMFRTYRPAYSTSTGIFRVTTGVPTGRHQTRQVDAADLGTTNLTSQTIRPNIQFEIVSAPGVPTNPVPSDGATIIPTNPTLSWTPGAVSSFFDVYFDTNPVPTTLVSDDQVGSSWSPPSNLNPFTTYYWYVHAFNGQGNTPGPVWSFTTGAGASPNAPSGGFVSGVTNTSLTMNWVDNSLDESAFDLYNSNDGTAFGYLTSTGADVTSFTNTGLGPNQRRWYRVFSFGNGFQSTGFASADGWTLCNVPGVPTVTVPAAPAGYSGVTIVGLPADGNPGTTLYRVGVRDAGNNFLGWIMSGATPREVTIANWNNISVTGLVSAQSYYFFAAAKNGANVLTEGPNSSLVTLLDLNYGGPDNFSYRYKTNYGPAGAPTVAYNWITLTSPTTLTLSGDDNEANLPFGNFWFPFYGNVYNSGRMATNNALVFGVATGDVTFSNTTLPTAASGISGAQAGLFPMWDDSDWGINNLCQYQDFGNYFVIQVTNNPRYLAPTELLTYQMILYNDGRIKYQFQSIVGVGWTPTIGIQGSSVGANGLFLQYGAAQTTVFPSPGLAILFYRHTNQSATSNPPIDVSGGGSYPTGGWVQEVGFVGGTPPGGSYFSTTEILSGNQMYNVTAGLPGGYTPGNDPVADGLATGAQGSSVIVQVAHNMPEPFVGYTACLTFSVPNNVDPTTVRLAWRTSAANLWQIVPNSLPYSYTFGPGQLIAVCGLDHFSEWLMLSEDLVLPVQMSSFSATGGNSQVVLNWRTESELNNDHFNIYRSENANVRGELIATVNGRGTPTSGSNYRFVDTRVVNGKTYFYRIADVDVDGYEAIHPFVVNATPAEGAVGIVPTEYSLSQNTPNPFNPTTEIRYAIKEAVKVELSVYDVNGRLVANLVDGVQTPNVYSVNFNATNLSAGVYFYQLRAGDYYSVKKMMLVR